MSIYAIASPVYQPAMRAILSITNANPALVTTTIDGVTPADHDYITGTIVRLDIPLGFGMFQADKLIAPITVVSPTTFTIDINTSSFDAFVIPTTYPLNYQQAQVKPVGELNSMLTASTINVL